MTAQIRVKLITEHLAAQYYQKRRVQAGEEKQLNVLELCTNGISLVVLVRSSKGDCLAKGSILLDGFTSHFLLQDIVCDTFWVWGLRIPTRGLPQRLFHRGLLSILIFWKRQEKYSLLLPPFSHNSTL